MRFVRGVTKIIMEIFNIISWNVRSLHSYSDVGFFTESITSFCKANILIQETGAWAVVSRV